MRTIDADALVALYEQEMKNNLIDTERGIGLSHLITKEDVAFFKAFVDKVPTVSPWRDVNDYPDNAREVIVQDEFGNVYIASYVSAIGWLCSDEAHWLDEGYIKRWMDIPQ